jgi:hypothetical protein
MTKLWDWVAEKFASALVRGWEMAQERIQRPERPLLTNERKVTNGKK